MKMSRIVSQSCACPALMAIFTSGLSTYFYTYTYTYTYFYAYTFDLHLET
jgi:hypothetical protein